MKYYLDYKVTSWKRIEVDEKVISEVQNWLESNDDVEFILDDYKLQDYTELLGNLYDTEEYMTVSENNGENTIELIDEDNLILWENKNIKDTINNSTYIGLSSKFNSELKDVLSYLNNYEIVKNVKNGKVINLELKFKGDKNPNLEVKEILENLLIIEDSINKLKK